MVSILFLLFLSPTIAINCNLTDGQSHCYIECTPTSDNWTASIINETEKDGGLDRNKMECQKNEEVAIIHCRDMKCVEDTRKVCNGSTCQMKRNYNMCMEMKERRRKWMTAQGRGTFIIIALLTLFIAITCACHRWCKWLDEEKYRISDLIEAERARERKILISSDQNKERSKDTSMQSGRNNE